MPWYQLPQNRDSCSGTTLNNTTSILIEMIAGKICPRLGTVGTAVLTCNMLTLQEIQNKSEYVQRYYTEYFGETTSWTHLAEIPISGNWASDMKPAESASYTANVGVTIKKLRGSDAIFLSQTAEASAVRIHCDFADCGSGGCAYPLWNWSPSSTKKVSPK
jgi:hypothetical protein